ncbi:MAG: ABC transporter permease [Thermomicrobiales bacterium]|nr:ABC transporter permease [Thermomicrobiales bacterium]
MSLSRYILRRLALTAITLLGVIIAVFLMARVLPGDPVTVKAGQYATPEIKEQLRIQMGLDKPLPQQLATYIGNVLQGDLGQSTRSGHTVREDIGQRLPVTLELALASLIVAGGIGIPLGIYAALHHGSKRDAGIQQLAIFSAATPVFWLGLVLIYLFYARWNIAPAPVGQLSTNVEPPRTITHLLLVDSLLTLNWTTFKDAAGHLILPVITLSVVVMSPFIKMARTSMLNVLGSDYITAARSLGLSDREIIRQDALKNVMVQLLTVSGIVLGYLLAGNVLVETIFAWPGLGFYAWNALTGSDYDAIQGFVLVVAVIYVFLNFFVDLAYTLIDPRIRLA